MYRSGEDRRSRVSRGLVVNNIRRYSGFLKKIITISKSLKKTGKRLRFWIRGLVLTNFPESLMCLVDPFKARDCFARSCVM